MDSTTFKKNAPLLVLIALTSCLYFFTNNSHGSTYMLQTVFDERIPRLSMFAIPYMIYLPWLWGTVIYSFFKSDQFRHLAYSLIIVNIVACIVFLLFQTYLPREPVVVNDFFSWLLGLIYGVDQPYNCFPSLHVALSSVIATYFVCTKSKWSWIFVSTAVLIAISTLFVKQHYIADVISGAILGLIVMLTVFHFLPDK